VAHSVISAAGLSFGLFETVCQNQNGLALFRLFLNMDKNRNEKGRPRKKAFFWKIKISCRASVTK
jgi:hypothetical protein